MKPGQIAVQLYTLRDHCRTAPEYAETLKKVRSIGYPAVQLSGVGPIPETELRSIADSEGIVICATHEGGELILKTPEKVVERLQALGCKYTAYPFPAGIDFKDPSSVSRLISQLDAAGAVLREAGCVLSYHNHAHEFYKEGSQTILEEIYDGTEPANLRAELDTYWIQAGGGNPVAWCRRMKGRLSVLHLKDYAVSPTGAPFFAEVGYGNLDFKAITAAAEESGCEWFVVEQDTCPGDPFESVAKSFDYIQANLVSR
jgi:sugar phosphate isomerase/epimerase